MKTLFNFFLFLFVSFGISAQTFSTIAENLRGPLGLDIASDGKIWVTEIGYGANDGTVSVLQPDGSLAPVVVGLPSIFDTVNQESVGPWRSMFLPGNHLGVLSPLSGGILVYDLNGFVPGVTPPITAASSTSQVIIYDFVIANEPPTMPDSDPYSAALDNAGNFYVVDAAFNGIIKVDAATGQRSVFAQFPRFPNPLPFGPPEVDQVPTRIVNKPGGGFYVCTLTGFPFLDGAAGVYSVDMNGNVSLFSGNLTLLTDLALDPASGNLYALQLGQFVFDPVPGFAPNTARVIRIKPDGSQQVVAENFGPAVGIALTAGGDLLVSGTFDGKIWKIEGVTSAAHEGPYEIVEMSLSPNPAISTSFVQFDLDAPSPAYLRVRDASGKMVLGRDLGNLNAGKNACELDLSGFANGAFFVEIQTNKGLSVRKLIRN